jgi:15-cis-phytoene synthase
MMILFDNVSQQCSRITTQRYSTSFSWAIRLLRRDIRPHIHNIYGLVRFADEIVDTFHGYNKALLLQSFKQDTFRAIEEGISMNPILHSFQLTVNKYQIPLSLIEAFFRSMEKDLVQVSYNADSYNEYIYGSAEVVGLMCLQVFCLGNQQQYEQLSPYARSLGAAFQKVNFLRDIKADNLQLSRMYFPGCSFQTFNRTDKQTVEAEIAADFAHAYEGIQQLPVTARFGVYVAYKYYHCLFKKIKSHPPDYILQNRVRIPNYSKAFILSKAMLYNRLNLL